MAQISRTYSICKTIQMYIPMYLSNEAKIFAFTVVLAWMLKSRKTLSDEEILKEATPNL